MADNKRILEAKDNLELIILIAKDYADRGLTQEELTEVGKDGIAKAREHYKANQNFGFQAYAVWWIRQAMLQAIAERGWLRES